MTKDTVEAVTSVKGRSFDAVFVVMPYHKLKMSLPEIENQTVASELTHAVFNTSARMILKLGIATTVLTGGTLLVGGEISLLTLFAFLILVSRVYDPLIGALDNLMAMMMINIQCRRMDEILNYPEQKGTEKLTNKGYDITFDHVEFSYNSGETVLKDVSFTARQGQVTALVGPSGGGKTTVSRLAARFWDIWSSPTVCARLRERIRLSSSLTVQWRSRAIPIRSYKRTVFMLIWWRSRYRVRNG